MTIPEFSGAKVLITGGLGFIGSNLGIRLAQLGAQVTLVDSLIPEYGGNLHNIDGYEPSLHVNVSDVRDPHGMRQLVKGVDYLFNLAGQTSHMDSMYDPYADLEINARSQLHILEACRNFNPSARIVFASTRQVYGRPDSLPVNEDHPIRPVDVNGVNKVAGEQYHLLYHNVYDLKTSVLRLTNTYGPRMRIKDSRQTFLGIWIRRLVEGNPFEVWGGSQLRDYTYVDDAVDAFLRAATQEAEGRIYNVGAEASYTVKETADILVKSAGTGSYSVKPYPEERLKIDIGDYRADDSRLRRELGWNSGVSLEDGLGRTVAYYRERLEQYL